MKKMILACVFMSILFLTSCAVNDPASDNSTPLFASSIPSIGADDKLEIVMVTPQEKVFDEENLQAITVSFNQPMVPLTVIDSESTVKLKIEPPVNGKYRWLGSATLSFIPLQSFPKGTSYKVTIPAGTKSLAGKVLDKDYSWTFDACPPQLVASYPKEGGKYVARDSKLLLYFNQIMNPVIAEKSIKFSKLNGQSCAFKLTSFDETKKITDLIPFATNEMVGWNKKNILVLSPAEPLDINSKYTIRLESDLRSKDGGLILGPDVRVLFETEKTFEFVAVGESNKVKPDGLFQVTFANPVHTKDFWKHAKFSPEIKKPDFSETLDTNPNNRIESYLDLKAGKNYALTIDKDLKDIYGNSLGKDVSANFVTLDYEPRVYIPEGNGIVESESDRNFPLKFMNTESIHINAVPIVKNEVVNFVENQYPNENLRRYAMNFTPSINEDVRLNFEKNKEYFYPLKLDRALKNGKGVAYLSFNNTNSLKDKNSNFYSGIVQVTNLAIQAKLSPANGAIWITSLDKGLPVKDVSVEIRNENNKVLWEGKTGPDGTVSTKGFIGLSGGQFDGNRPKLYVIAEKSGDISFLTADWDWSCGDGWNFNIDSQTYWGERIYKASIFTEKGLYSPGSKVLIKGLLREKKNGKWLTTQSKDFMLRIADSRGTTIAEKTVKLSSYGSFDSALDLSVNAPTGRYDVSFIEKHVSGDKYITSGEFLVQEYKSADYGVEVSIPNKTYIYGEKLAAKYSAKWLFDAPVKGAKSYWSINAKPYYFSPEGYETYNFSGDLYNESNFDYVSIAEGEGNLDNRGSFDFSAKLENTMIKSSVQADVTATVTSSANASVSNTSSFVLHRGKYYIGSKVKLFAVPTGKPQNISLVAITPDVKPMSTIQVTTDILTREWHSVRKEVLGEGTSWVSEKKDKVIKTVKNNLSQGKVDFDFTPEKSGYYVARTTSKDSLGNEIVSEVSFYAFGDGYVSWERSDDDIIELVKDKKTYNSGDVAKIIIKSPYESAKAMITVEKDYIVSRELIDVEGSAFAIDIPITDKDSPGIFVSAVLVQGRSASKIKDGVDIGKPSFKIGYVELPIKSDKQRLKVSVTPDKTKYEPGQKATLKVKLTDSKGTGIKGEIVLAVVDKGVLSLINYKLPDLFDVFYGQNTLFVESFETRRNVIGQRDYGEKGETDGGGGGDESSSTTRKNFKDTAYWNPSIITDANGNAEVSFDLPDNLTTFSIMSVAFNSDSFSSGDKTEIITSKPLLLKNALPSFAFLQDHISGGVTVYNGTGAAQNVNVSLKAEGISVDGVSEKSVSILPGREQVVYFDLISKKIGTAKLTFNASGKEHSDSIECSLPIKISETSIETVSSFAISKDMIYNEKISLPDSVMPDIGGLSLTLSSSILENLRVPMNFLALYPYECLEQRISRVMPMLCAKELALYGGYSETKINESIKDILEKMPSCQRYDGGFSLWSGSTNSSEYLSCYAMEMLALSKKQKYAVNEDMYRNGILYLRELAKKSMDKAWGKPYSETEKYFLKSYALYVLYLSGIEDAASLNIMCERIRSLDSLSMAYLLKTLTLTSGNESLKEQIRTELLNNIKLENSFAFFTVPKDYENYLLYPSDIKATALIMSALLTGDRVSNVEKMAVYLNDKMKDSKNLTTQDSVFAISALSDYFAKVEKHGQNDFFASIRFDGKELAGAKLDGKQNTKISATAEMKDLIGKPDTAIRFEKNGTGVMYCTSVLNYMPSGKISAKSQGMTILRKIVPLSMEKNAGGSFKAGNIYKVTVSVITPVNRSYIVVNEPIPAGFSAVNTAFVTESPVLANIMESLKRQSKNLNGYATFNHEEFYNDKVLIFADTLSKGEHTYTYLLRAVNPGVYSVNPSKAFMMYYPEVFANTDSGEITIK